MGFGTRTCKLKMVLSGYKPSDASLTRVRENFFFEKVFWCRKRCTSYRRKDRILPTSRDNNVSDEGFQYFFYTVIRDSRDLILSKSRGVELTFKNSPRWSSISYKVRGNLRKTYVILNTSRVHFCANPNANHIFSFLIITVCSTE